MSSFHDLAQVDLNLLVVLEDLLRSRSTTVTARRLGRTQSAVSHSLARLRETFGDRLFFRAGSTLQPTAMAERLEGPLRELLLQARAVTFGKAAPLDPARIERTFVVACADYAEVTIFPRLLPVLRRDAPGIDIVTRFHGNESDRAAQTREVDLAYGARFRALSGLVVQAIGPAKMIVLLRKGHPALSRRLTARRYADLAHVAVMPRGLPGSPADDALDLLGLRRRVVLRTQHFASAAVIVARTDLVVTLPESIARELGRTLGLVSVPVPFPLADVGFEIGFSATLEHDPAHRWFRTRFREAAGTA